MTDPIFRAVDHIGIAVADLDQALTWYADTFGMTVTHREVNEEQGVVEAMLSVDPSASGPQTQLQILAPTSPDSAIAKFLDRSGPGVQQVAYRVDDVDEAAATLRARGLRVLYDTARTGTGGSRINFIHPADAGGVLVELVEPRRNS